MFALGMTAWPSWGSVFTGEMQKMQRLLAKALYVLLICYRTIGNLYI